MRNKKCKSDFTQHVLEYGLNLMRVTIKTKFLSLLKKENKENTLKRHKNVYRPI
jgi:hypothetical protein